MFHFDDIYEAYYQYVYHVARRIVGVEDAEDVGQQVWMKVWCGRDTFRGDAEISTWLYRIAWNTAISHLRKRHARIQAEPLPDDVVVYDVAPSPSEQLEYQEQRRELERRVRTLSTIHREALLASFDGSTLDSRAERLGLPTSTLKTRTWRARMLVTAS